LFSLERYGLLGYILDSDNMLYLSVTQLNERYTYWPFESKFGNVFGLSPHVAYKFV